MDRERRARRRRYVAQHAPADQPSSDDRRADLGRPLPAMRPPPGQFGLSLASYLGQVAQVGLSDLDGAKVLLDPVNFGQRVLAASDITRKEECGRP
jgi:hypothetical protein